MITYSSGFRTDYTWAWAMGYDGLQYDDSDGLSVGQWSREMF